MYTNEVLEEKYKSQLELLKKAKNLSKGYNTIIEEEVYTLFNKMGWTLRFSKRKGEWHPPISNSRSVNDVSLKHAVTPTTP